MGTDPKRLHRLFFGSLPQAGANMEQLMKDPDLMATVQEQIAASMNGAAMA